MHVETTRVTVTTVAICPTHGAHVDHTDVDVLVLVRDDGSRHVLAPLPPVEFLPARYQPSAN